MTQIPAGKALTPFLYMSAGRRAAITRIPLMIAFVGRVTTRRELLRGNRICQVETHQTFYRKITFAGTTTRKTARTLALMTVNS